MKKLLCSALIGSAALMMLATSPSWAQQTVTADATTTAKPGGPNPPKPPKAPEIDVGAGGAGLTVLAIALLLAAERRSRSY